MAGPAGIPARRGRRPAPGTSTRAKRTRAVALRTSLATVAATPPPTTTMANGAIQAQLIWPASLAPAVAGYHLLEPTLGAQLEVERQQVVIGDRRAGLGL